MAALLPGNRVPQVVVLILGGILIGPQVFGLADTGSIELFSNVGLGFVFLLAGYELDPALFRERYGRLALIAWVDGGRAGPRGGRRSWPRPDSSTPSFRCR